MRTLMIASLIGVAAASASTPAVARQGCGIGFHRAVNGRCVVNRAGVFYRGYGWWDGRRYWQRRYRYRGGWRYR